MHPIEEDDALGRLETRVQQLASVIQRLKDKNVELQRALEHVAAERDQAVRAADESRAQSARLVEEADGLRSRHKEAASRVKAVLAQLEGLEIPSED
jgi:hypothetical protein